MKNEVIAEMFKQFFTKRFNDIVTKIYSGELNATGNWSIPSNIKLTSSSNHYVLEMYGAIKPLPGLFSLKIDVIDGKDKSTNELLNPHNSDVSGTVNEMFVFEDSVNNQLINLTYIVGDPIDVETLIERTKIDRLRSGTILMSGSNMNSVINIGENSDKIVLSSVDMFKIESNRVYYRYHQHTFVFKPKTIFELDTWLSSLISNDFSFGFNLRNESLNKTKLNWLMSLIDSKVSENELDSFIRSNIELFSKSLGYKSAIPQDKSEILESNTTGIHRVIPDYLMIDSKNKCDILDLKLANLTTLKLTTKHPSRTQFVSYGTDLIGQLNGYDRFYSEKENSKSLYKRHGIRVNKPLLIGIIGNKDSFIKEEVDIALRPLDDRYVLYDWHTIAYLMLAA